MKKKCHICKSYFQIEDFSQDDYIYNSKNKKFYHFECLFEEEIAKQKTKKRNVLSKDNIAEKLKEIRTNSINAIKQMFAEEELYNFIHNAYSIVSIPRPFEATLNKVISGEYKGLSKGVPIEDILEMWKQRKNDLDKIHQYNTQKKGKVFDKSARLSYDLAVLIGKYDSFLEWKQKMIVRDHIQKETISEESKKQKINFKKVVAKTDIKNIESLSYEDIINEI